MALTKTTTKKMPANGNVGVHFKLDDAAVTVIEKDYTESFTKGEGATEAVENAIAKAIQKDVDEYKENKAMFDSAAMDTAVSNIDGKVTL